MDCYKKLWAFLILIASVGHAATPGSDVGGGAILSTGYPSIQEAIDANAGRTILVPDGDHVITKGIRITGCGTGLCGWGRIIQADPAEPVLTIEHASDVRIRDITLTRAEGKTESTASGVACADVQNMVLEGVRVRECCSSRSAISLYQGACCVIRNCEVINYKRIAIDDRTTQNPGPFGSYAFHAIDGTGIGVQNCVGTVIQGNRIIEHKVLPTPELKRKHRLGTLTEGRYPSKPGPLVATAFEKGYVNNWHQGSGIVVTGPDKTRNTVISGNYIENAAQGFDLHCDNAVVTGNTVNHGMMGVKAMHGSRNLIISSNMLTHIDLWGILLNPGAGSHRAEPARGNSPARPANTDGGTVIANNIITDYGYGHEYWNWGGAQEDRGSSYGILLDVGQLEDNPPLADVLVQGNIVYNTGRDGVLVDGKPKLEPPRYRYAVFIGGGKAASRPANAPKEIHVANNIFHPGTDGVSNVELKP